MRHRQHRRGAVVLSAITAAISCAAPVAAQPSTVGSTSASGPATGSLPPSAEAAARAAAEAKELNRQGLALVQANDLQRALDFFLRSREVLPTTKNTTNAALALDQLGRYDEALELYEELLLKYAGGLDDEDRAAIAPAMEALRTKVGSVYLTSNVAGSVVVDGRPRGKLPLPKPLRLLAGKHQLRIARNGYTTFEKTVDVVAGATLPIDARLEPLKGVGQLMVENLGAGDSDVFVDGVRVGATPWEGSLAPGRHLVWLRRGDSGSAPVAVHVLEGQAAVTQLQTKRLGPPLTIRVEPPTASFEVAGVTLGPGSWRGQLPVGGYSITASEAGYRTQRQRVELPAAGSPIELTLRMPVDPDHPRWPRAAGHFWAELHGGLAAGTSLGSDVGAGCPDECDAEGAVLGLVAGVRGGYRLPFGGSIELGGGYMRFRQSIDRTETDTFGDQSTPIAYELSDEVGVHGPYASVGLGYRRNVTDRVHLGGRAAFGLLVASSSDPLTGTAFAGGSSARVFVERGDESVTSVAPFIAPELYAGVAVGPFEIGLSLGAAAFLADGPVLDRGRFGAQTDDGVTDPSSALASPESDVLEREQAYSQFVLFVPQLSFGGSF
jgi:hypothetical protein